MSIESEVNSTIENIKLDYEGLENLGADLTNVNKNIQNIRTCLDNIYSSLPKTTGEGSNLSLTTLKGKMNIIPKGDTQQDTYSGKNLYPSGTSTQTIGGITFTPQEDGGLKVKGTSTYANYYVAGGDGNYVEVANLSNKAETMTFSVSGMQNGIQVYVVGTNLGVQGITNTDGTAAFTTIANDTYRIFIRVMAEYSVDTTLYIQLEKGNSATSFEKYVGGTASPNPSYPQDINVVTGTQEVLVQNKNLIPLEQADFTTTFSGQNVKIKNQTIKISGSATGNYSIMVGENGLVNATSTDRITFEIPSGSYIYTQFASGTVTNINVRLKDENTNTMYRTGQTITLTETHTFSINILVEGTDSKNATINIQLEKGSTQTDFVEHQEQTKTLHLSSKNLAHIEAEGKFRANATGNFVINAAFNSYIASVKPNTTYISSAKDIATQYIYITNLCYFDKNMTYISGSAYNTANKTFTTPNNCYYVTIAVNTNAENVQLEEGSTATTYEPYYNYELSKIGTYQDRIYKNSDKWYIEKNIGKVVLNGSETWQQAGSVVSGTARYFYNNNDVYRDTNPNSTTIYVMSNKFKGMYWNQIYTIDTTSLNGVANYNNASGTGRIVIRMDDNSISPLTNTVENFKTWLASNGVEVYFVKTTTTYEEITNTTLLNELNELDKMMSYSGQTNISISGNLPMLLSVSALKGE